MAKLFSSEVAMEIALNAVRIHGGYRYSTEFDVERYFRDAPLMIVGEGTNEIQRNVIAAQLVARAAFEQIASVGTPEPREDVHHHRGGERDEHPQNDRLIDPRPRRGSPGLARRMGTTENSIAANQVPNGGWNFFLPISISIATNNASAGRLTRTMHIPAIGASGPATA